MRIFTAQICFCSPILSCSSGGSTSWRFEPSATSTNHPFYFPITINSLISNSDCSTVLF